jgi:DNA primase
LRYIEATLDDIALANTLAHEVLGRTLDELPPQTRRLLGLVVAMADEACVKQQMPRTTYRFSRRDVREHTKWGDTQLKIHLARLTELEYLLIHRGGRGQSFEYELLYDGRGESEERRVSGLIDVEALRNYDAERSGQNESRSGVGRPVVGGQSVGGRMPENAAPPKEPSSLAASRANGAENARSRSRETASYVAATA